MCCAHSQFTAPRAIHKPQWQASRTLVDRTEPSRKSAPFLLLQVRRSMREMREELIKNMSELSYAHRCAAGLPAAGVAVSETQVRFEIAVFHFRYLRIDLSSKAHAVGKPRPLRSPTQPLPQPPRVAHRRTSTMSKCTAQRRSTQAARIPPGSAPSVANRAASTARTSSCPASL